MTDFDTSGFLASFFDEARGRLASVNRRLVLLESDQLDDEGMNLLNRDLHTIKGAAQMLGVQDVGMLAHLLEDVVVFVSAIPKQDSGAAVQLLFELHDQLAERLKHEDNENRLDGKELFEHFHTMKNDYQNSRSDDASLSITPAIAEPKPKRRRKKRQGVNKSLIAAVMGSIEGSIQADKVANVETEADVQDAQKAIVKPVAKVDYRPALSRIESIKSAQEDDSSGDFFRVDRSKLNRLSNQIIELSSDRYRGDPMEVHLERLHADLKLLKDSLLSKPEQQTVQSLKMRSDLEHSLINIQRAREAFRVHQKRSSMMQDSLKSQVFDLMLRPLDSVFSLFPRAVRDIARKSHKKVQLLIAGESVEMDQIAAESLVEPLIHLINNAIAHGIETPGQRDEAGKPEEGQITIHAYKSGAEICIEVIDDGNGIDITQLREKAVETGMISLSEAENMASSEVLELIFLAGFSTRSNADSTAGRGIGLNVVSDVLRELTGTIHIQTEHGKGTKFILTVPVSLTLQKAVEFIVDGKRFGVLSNLVSYTVLLDKQEIKTGKGSFSHSYIDYSDHKVPVIDLHNLLAMKQEPSAHHSKSIIIIEHMEGFLAIIVDELFDEKEIMVREIDPYLKQYQPLGLMGNAIAEDGTVLLLIEPNGLKQMWRTTPDTDLDDTILQQSTYDRRILLVDDSPIARKLEQQMFESMGFSVDIALGSADALENFTLDKYALLVTDFELSGIHGIELTEKVKEKQPDMPVLMLATQGSEEEQKKAKLAGVGRYLIKRRLKGHEKELLEALEHLLIIDDSE